MILDSSYVPFASYDSTPYKHRTLWNAALAGKIPPSHPDFALAMSQLWLFPPPLGSVYLPVTYM
jgi:hypothetical protein